MSKALPTPGPVRKGQSPMTEELVAQLRDRIATRYYEQPQVIDAMARAILSRARKGRLTEA